MATNNEGRGKERMTSLKVGDGLLSKGEHSSANQIVTVFLKLNRFYQFYKQPNENQTDQTGSIG